MAEGILFPVAELIIETLGSAAVQEIKSLWNVKDELHELEATLSTIKAVLTDAEKQQINKEQVRVWLQRLEDAFYLADDLVDEVSTEGLLRQMKISKMKRVIKEVRTFFSGSNQLVFGCKMARKIKDVRKKLAKIAADRKDFHLDENVSQGETKVPRPRRETHSFVPSEDVIGRDDAKNAILRLLLESVGHDQEKVSVIPIVGMGGLGKTTLAQLVFNDDSVQNHFELKFWVCVSDDFDVKLLAEKILKDAGGESTKDLEFEQLQKNLRNKLAGKRYLLVLDDVWNENSRKWKNLKALLSDCVEGSRIIVTTRSKEVARITRTRDVQPYDLGILDPDNSWSLFKKLALEQGQEEPNSTIVDVGKEIVKKCGGNPLAISVLGSMLYGGDPETDWPSFLQKELSNIDFQEEDSILPTLKLSYDCLPSHLKRCFAYCSLFPKDYKINVQMLVSLWIAQGFIKQPSDSSQSLEEIGYEYFMELLWRSFFEEDYKDEFEKQIITCKMHDLIHDLAMQVAGRGCATLSSKERNIDQSIRNVSFNFGIWSSKGVPSSLLQSKRLRSILLLDQRRSGIEGESICDLIASNFEFLRTLDLNRSEIKILPNSIGRLKHLRYLDLSYNTEMETVPTCITELVNLQTLKLNGCWELKELPRDIHKLQNLRHLDLSDNRKMETLPTRITELVNLQTLKLNECNQLKELPRDIHKLRNLRHLDLSDNRKMETLPTCITELVNLQTLKLKGCWKLKELPRDIHKLRNLHTLPLFVLSDDKDQGSKLDELEELNSLSGELEIRGLRSGMESKNANLKGKHKLQHLSLEWSWIDSYDSDGDVSSSEQKHEMTIEGLQPHPNLRELTLVGYGGVKLSSCLPLLTNLDSLELVRCMKCQQLPPLNQFPSLKKMKLKWLYSLEYIINDEVGGSKVWTSSTSSSSRTVVLSIHIPSSLQQLELTNLPVLKGWWRLPDHSDIAETQVVLPSFPRLSQLTIWNCPKLSCMPLYPNVEILTLDNTSWKPFEQTALTTAVEDQASSSSSAVDPSSPLSKLRSLCLEKLVDQRECLPDWMKSLTCLKKLVIVGNPKLKYLSPGIQYLTSLQELEISNCEELIEISDGTDSIKWEAFTSLSSLKFDNQQNLVSLPEGLQRATTLQYLLIESCANFGAIPDWIFGLGSLKGLALFGCPNLKSLPGSISSLTSLRTLSIMGCPALVERCQRDSGEDWPKIQHIPYLHLR